MIVEVSDVSDEAIVVAERASESDGRTDEVRARQRQRAMNDRPQAS